MPNHPRESRICGIVDRYTPIQCHIYYMHFILLFLLLLLHCMLLECTHCFVALNMHENQQHPPHWNKPYNYARMQSGVSIAFSIRCLLTWQLCSSIFGNSEVLWCCIVITTYTAIVLQDRYSIVVSCACLHIYHTENINVISDWLSILYVHGYVSVTTNHSSA